MSKEEMRWDLSQLVVSTDPTSVRRTLESMVAEAGKLRDDYYGKIGGLDAEGLLGLLELSDSMTLKYGGVTLYCSLLYSANALDDTAKQLNDASRTSITKMGQTLAFVDIEGVWPVNLEHGPLVADALIAQAAKVIERLVRGGDFVAHWAGARFALLLQGPKDEVLVGTDRILIGIRAFAPVVRAGEQPLTISANMGGTSIPPADPDSEFAAPALIKEARGMLMAAKASDSDDPVFS